MAHYSSILNQLLNLIPRHEFQRIVDGHQGDKRVRSFNCWRQFVCLFFGQLTGQHTLRDLITALNSGLHKLGHVGLGHVSRSTLADANSSRPHEIYRELFLVLYGRCRQLLAITEKRTFLDRFAEDGGETGLTCERRVFSSDSDRTRRAREFAAVPR